MTTCYTESEEVIHEGLRGHRGLPPPPMPGTDIGVTLLQERETTPLRILLADDHLMIRQRVRALLEQEGFEVAGEASDGREAVSLAQQLRPDLVILDVSMPALNGFAAVGEILRDAPATRAILLTLHAERLYVLKAIRAGVRGYVVKPRMDNDLPAAIQEVARGNIYVSPRLSETASAISS
jgi:DNA-binding NarL/FixJ family response regulator